jgi:hypothetical protein
LSASIVTVQVSPLDPLHAPPQVQKRQAPVGVAVKVTGVPPAKLALHVPLLDELITRSIPAGELVIRPLVVSVIERI